MIVLLFLYRLVIIVLLLNFIRELICLGRTILDAMDRYFERWFLQNYNMWPSSGHPLVNRAQDALERLDDWLPGPFGGHAHRPARYGHYWKRRT